MPGCTYNSACNFNVNATDDDGSCFTPELYYNCSGLCINDGDADGVCDELEQYGCTDPSACNFDINATENNGLCYYSEEFFDCDENCLNDQNNNEICDELEIYGCTDNNFLGNS